MWLRMAVSKLYPTPFDPTLGVKGQIFKFRNNKSMSIFLLKFCTQAEQQYLCNIRDFSLNAWARSPMVYLVGGTAARMNLFSEYGYVAY